MKTKILIHSIAAALALASAAALHAQTVLVNDTFTLGGTRTEGSTLGGATAETGLLAAKNAWNASSVTFTADGAATSSTVNAQALIGIMPAGTTAFSDIFSVSASITNKGGQVGLGFGGSNGLSGTDALYLRLRPDGAVWIYVNNSSSANRATWTDSFESTLGAWDTNATYTITLQVNPTASTARVLVGNGTTSVSAFAANDGWFAVTNTTFGTAGFQFVATAAGIAVDNFSVISAQNFVPEPAVTAAILGLVTALAVAVAALRRR